MELKAPRESSTKTNRSAPRGTSGPTVSEFELGLGWYFLPLSEVCTTAECKKVDTSPLFHLNILIHPHKNWSFGAGAAFGLLPTTIPELDAAAQSAERFLVRSYLEFDALARYYPWRHFAGQTHHFEPWIGPALGVLVLNDRYRSESVDQTGPLRIGAPGVTLASPAFSLRGVLGFDYGISRLFFFGGQVSPGLALFPKDAKTTSFGDTATLRGPQLTLSATVGLKLLVDM